MTKLQELYETREKLQNLGIEPNADLERQLAALEEDFIKNEIVPQMKEAVSPVLEQVKRELIFIVKYYPEEGAQVQLSRIRNENSLPKITNIVHSEENAESIKTDSFKKKEATYGRKNKSDILLQKKNVDWSLLTRGVTLTFKCYNIVQNELHWGVKPDDARDVKVIINGECFNARFLFKNYDDRNYDIMQIRYSPGSPITQKLQEIFHQTYKELEIKRLYKEKGFQYQNSLKERYIEIYATSNPNVFRFVVI